MNVTITGPNPHGGMFHVHRTGCADLSRGVYRTIRLNYEKYEEEHASVQSVVEECYSDQIAEDPDATWEDYLSEFKFFPCTDDLPHDEREAERAADKRDQEAPVIRQTTPATAAEILGHAHKGYEADNCPRCGTAAVIPEARS